MKTLDSKTEEIQEQSREMIKSLKDMQTSDREMTKNDFMKREEKLIDEHLKQQAHQDEKKR